MTPGGGGIGEFGSTDALYTGQLAAMRVCAYRGAHSPTSVVLGTAQANAVAQQLNAAPATDPNDPCPANTDALGGTITIYAVDADGHAAKPVTITLACSDSQATNGTAVRYVNDLPPELLRAFSAGDTILPPPAPKSGH